MSKNRLIAFGCSNTYGEALPDCWIKANFGKNYMSGPNPSNFAWPSVLSERLNLDCVNLAKPGVSNKWICNEILNTDFVPTDLVVILWTYFDRSCIFQDDGSNKRLMIQDVTNLYINDELRKYTKEYYKKYHTNTNAIHESYLNINYAKLYLDSIGIKNYHFTCSNDVNMNNFVKSIFFKWNNVDMLDKLDYTKCRTDSALDKLHPGITSQKNIANEIHKLIKEENN